MGMGGEGVTNQEMNTHTAIPIQLLSYSVLSQKQLKLKVSRALFVLICHYREDNNNLLS